MNAQELIEEAKKGREYGLCSLFQISSGCSSSNERWKSISWL